MASLKERIGTRGMRMRRQRRVNARNRKIAEEMKRDRDAHHAWYRRLVEKSSWDDTKIAKAFIPAVAMVNSPSQVQRMLEEAVQETGGEATPISFMMQEDDAEEQMWRELEEQHRQCMIEADAVIAESKALNEEGRRRNEEDRVYLRNRQLEMALVDRQPRSSWLQSWAYWLGRIFAGRV